jgi:hypothetical protein
VSFGRLHFCLTNKRTNGKVANSLQSEKSDELNDL